MKNFLISILAVVLLVAAVLILMGAKPADLLHEPVAVFNNLILKKTATTKTADAETAPAAVAQPTPEPTATAAPRPVEAQATPVATPPAEAKPTPETVDLASLGGSPKEWPKFVTLKQKTAFPAVLNGQVIGSVQVPAGIQVNLLSLRGGEVQVQYQGGSKLIPAQTTDLIERVLAARHTTRR
jgi:hypothetical protein